MDEFLEFTASILGVAPGSLSPVTSYESIPEWDSIMHLRLVMEIAEKYGVDIPLERIPEIRTLADFYAFVAK